jgi:hypothetical protein
VVKAEEFDIHEVEMRKVIGSYSGFLELINTMRLRDRRELATDTERLEEK